MMLERDKQKWRRGVGCPCSCARLHLEHCQQDDQHAENHLLVDVRAAKIEENGAKQRRQVGEALPRRFGDMGHRVAEKEIRSEIHDEAEPKGRDEVLNRNASNIDRRQQRRLPQDEPEQEHRHEARQEADLQRGIAKCHRQIGRLHQLNAPDP